MISYQREHVGWEFQWVFLETAVRHVMQFRTMPVSNPYQNVVHVHAANKSQEDLAKHQVSNRRVCEMFILGSPRADQHSARKAAASAAIHALNDAGVRGAIAPVYGGCDRFDLNSS